ncbi:MAG TPA: SAM-dependent chlorinase/fluorinase, partial [Rhodothermales bacterium]|nr:SAM-dependent chlorinase/fluorinase [Rhodothermales bacterium]
MPIITLTTDYGTRDPYVAALKGVLVTMAPSA